MTSSLFLHDDPHLIWVAPSCDGTCLGTYDAPYTTITAAVAQANPGNTIVLKAGEYTENVNIQNSGTISRPIRITADPEDGSGVTCLAGWFLYDASDIIVSNISFYNIPSQAFSVIGACARNSFVNLCFTDCGFGADASCTFFFGGSGAQCNIVENCLFEMSKNHTPSTNADLPIGLMITEGDSEDNAEPNTNHIFRRNRFINYGCAIVVGTHEDLTQQYSHIVEHNVIHHTSGDGIRIKCGDTSVRGNVLHDCQKDGIFITNGQSDLICNNRIVDCTIGIRAAGFDFTITNNCIIRSRQHAIMITTMTKQNGSAPRDAIIELNTCINTDAGNNPQPISHIDMSTDSFCMVRRNLLYGPSTPFSSSLANGSLDAILYSSDNIISGGCNLAKGCTEQTIAFGNSDYDDYSNNTGYGASGWMVESSDIPPREENDDTNAYQHAIVKGSTFFESSDHQGSDDTIPMFPNIHGGENDDSNLSSDKADADGVIDITDWD